MQVVSMYYYMMDHVPTYPTGRVNIKIQSIIAVERLSDYVCYCSCSRPILGLVQPPSVHYDTFFFFDRNIVLYIYILHLNQNLCYSNCFEQLLINICILSLLSILVLVLLQIGIGIIRVKKKKKKKKSPAGGFTVWTPFLILLVVVTGIK